MDSALLHMLEALRLTLLAAYRTSIHARDPLLEKAEAAAARALEGLDAKPAPGVPPAYIDPNVLHEYFEQAEDGTAKEFVEWYNARGLEAVAAPVVSPIKTLRTQSGTTSPVAPIPDNWRPLGQEELSQLALLEEEGEDDEYAG